MTVLPITHRAPDDRASAVEIPPPVKELLDLDRARSWIVVSEGNEFVWPGYDLRKVPGNPARYDYGFLPPRFFDSVLKAFARWHKTRRTRLTGNVTPRSARISLIWPVSLTVAGERDDICAVGQTVAAHDLCSKLRPYLKCHHMQAGVGHYGVFSASAGRTRSIRFCRM